MYALITDNAVSKYPYSVGELRRDNPQTSFPREMTDDRLAEWGVFPVTPISRPEVDHTKNVTEGTPEFDGQQWRQIWRVSDATPEEIAERTQAQADAVRFERDARLIQCDWTQLPDCPLSNVQQTAWATYRQSLRDLPSQSGFPFNVTWPVQP